MEPGARARAASYCPHLARATRIVAVPAAAEQRVSKQPGPLAARRCPANVAHVQETRSFPAATSSLAIARLVADQAAEVFGLAGARTWG